MSKEEPHLILIVDDEVSSRLLLKVQLKAFGYEFLEAADGLEAIQIFKSRRPDLVLMDVDMPQMDGFQAASVIKDMCRDSYIPILFVTGMEDESAVARSADVGGDDLLVKPLTPVVLESRLRAALQRSHLYHQLHDQRKALQQRQDHDEHEQELAKDIFSRIAHLGCLDEAGIEYIASALMVFNGDMLLAERTPYGALRVMLGDFTGHGLPAAVGSLPSAEIFYGMTAKGFHISEVVGELNSKLNRILPRGIFCAAAVIELNSENKQLTVWNGGLPHLLVYDAGNNNIRKVFESLHLALGILPPGDFDASVEHIGISAQDSLIAYSDGIVETENPAGELYGDQRLLARLQGGKKSGTCFQTIIDDLDGFREHAAQSDDYTLIEIPCGLENRVAKENEVRQAPVKVATDWDQQLTLNDRALAEVDPVPLLLQGMIHIQGLDRYREDLFTVLTELYINALDHGVLKLDSALKTDAAGFSEYFRLREERLAAINGGVIKISLEHTPLDAGGRLTMRIEDNGDGFDEQAVLITEDNERPAGRGIALVRSLCDSLTYMDGGRVALAVYCW